MRRPEARALGRLRFPCSQGVSIMSPIRAAAALVLLSLAVLLLRPSSPPPVFSAQTSDRRRLRTCSTCSRSAFWS